MDLVSPQPFWPLRNGLLSVYPALKEDVTCDVVVLGGECVFQRRRSAYLASRPSDAASLRDECAARRAAGIDVEYWDEAGSARGSRSQGPLPWYHLRGPSSTVIDLVMPCLRVRPEGVRVSSTEQWWRSTKQALTLCDCKQTAGAKSSQNTQSLPQATNHRNSCRDVS